MEILSFFTHLSSESWLVLALLLVMSIVSLTMYLRKLRQISKECGQGENDENRLLSILRQLFFEIEKEGTDHPSNSIKYRFQSAVSQLKSDLPLHSNAMESDEKISAFGKRGADGLCAIIIRRTLAKLNWPTESLLEYGQNQQEKASRYLNNHLLIIGTIGSIAVFIGLFGTVIGIIRAFADLAADSTGDPKVVMAGISEALVATAAGLFVAIPAVVFYNHIKSSVETIESQIRNCLRLVMAFKHGYVKHVEKELKVNSVLDTNAAGQISGKADDVEPGSEQMSNIPKNTSE